MDTVRKVLTILLILIALFIGFGRGKASSKEKNDSGYNDGYDSGYSEGYSAGYDEGYGEGVEDGKAQCLDSLGEELAAYEDVSYCVVFVTSDGHFHHHTCDLLGNDYLDNAYDMPHALSCGFSPCEECIPDYVLP